MMCFMYERYCRNMALCGTGDAPRFRSSNLDHTKLRLGIPAAEFPAGFILECMCVYRVEMNNTDKLSGMVERNKVVF